jgi:hypothetical protein
MSCVEILFIPFRIELLVRPRNLSVSLVITANRPNAFLNILDLHVFDVLSSFSSINSTGLLPLLMGQVTVQ